MVHYTVVLRPTLESKCTALNRARVVLLEIAMKRRVLLEIAMKRHVTNEDNVFTTEEEQVEQCETTKDAIRKGELSLSFLSKITCLPPCFLKDVRSTNQMT